MALEPAARRYWAMSQHLRRGCKSDAEREQFLNITVKPTINATRNPDEKRLLAKLTA